MFCPVIVVFWCVFKIILNYDIIKVANYLKKVKSTDLIVTMLHRILFNRPGESHQRKANLRAFNGTSKEDVLLDFKKKLLKYTVIELRKLCVLLNLERSGDRNIFVDRILNFLEKPIDYGESKPKVRKNNKKSENEVKSVDNLTFDRQKINYSGLVFEEWSSTSSLDSEKVKQLAETTSDTE